MQTLPAVHATLGVISKTMTIFLLKTNNFYAEFSVSPSSINLIAGLDRTRITKPKEIALRFSDCSEICSIVRDVDRVHCYRTAEAGHSRHFPKISHNLNLFPQA